MNNYTKIVINPENFGYEYVTTDRKDPHFLPYKKDKSIIAVLWGKNGIATIGHETKNERTIG